jgi:hypothetical protein
MPKIPIDDNTKLLYYGKLRLVQGFAEALLWENMKGNEVLSEKRMFMTVFFPTLPTMFLEAKDPYEKGVAQDFKKQIKELSRQLTMAAQAMGEPKGIGDLIEEEDPAYEGAVEVMMWLGGHPNIMQKISDD